MEIKRLIDLHEKIKEKQGKIDEAAFFSKRGGSPASASRVLHTAVLLTRNQIVPIDEAAEVIAWSSLRALLVSLL